MSSTAEATEETSGDQEEVATDERREALVERIRTELGDALIDHHILADTDLWIRVDRERWVDTGLFLRDGLGCAYFNFLSVIDWMPSPFGREMEAEVDADPEADTKEPEAMQQGVAGGDSRFQLFARVNNVIDHMGITIKTDLDDDTPSIDTWIPAYDGANWHEREAFEMYGVDFIGHPNLINLYLPTGFEGNPLRKDFPLLARRMKPWPGIVDVEQMPGDDEEDETEAST
ncbi:MAG: NADH-quinone oxidoreductase subunit C [Acidobacteria bacterium]|nr:NADH-quinone oxidoreductase subunit C [Acidobacteriota bacterium]